MKDSENKIANQMDKQVKKMHLTVKCVCYFN